MLKNGLVLLKNATVYDGDFEPKRLDILINGEKIEKVVADIISPEAEVIDLSGKTVLPGLIDVHIHGRAAHDTCDKSVDGLKKISETLAKKGITSFCPTSMTLPSEQLMEIFKSVKKAASETQGAYIHGINMEGPYISVAKKGAQAGTYVRAASYSEFERLNNAVSDFSSGDNFADSFIKIVTIAPECEGAGEFIQKASKFARVSIGHTDANYDIAYNSFNSGISQVTHLYNAMTGLTHREPGVVGAAFDYAAAHPENLDFFGELICDGHHIHPAALRIAFNALGENRSLLVSDSMQAAGMPDGEYELGGQKVFVRGGLATLSDGTIAASTTNIFDSLNFVLSIGVSKKQAIKSATINPARAVKVDSFTGSIEAGKNADILVVEEDDNSFKLHSVYIKGKKF